MNAQARFDQTLRLVIACGLTLLFAGPAHAGRSVAMSAPPRRVAATNVGFDDVWNTNFGMLALQQSDASGIRFTGVMTDAGNPRVRGIITGTLANDGRLSGVWSMGNRRGIFLNLTLDARGETFTGSASGYTTWCGARLGRPLPPGCAFAGQWTIELDGAGAGTATLTQTGMSVSGSYSTKLASGRLTGSVTFVNGLPVLNGKWSSARSGGLFKAYLSGFDARQFQGNFDGKLAFCGWRSNAAKPAVCLK
ncbi:MAG: hypothetical protein RMN52_16490 [Anaerolineae bacterium]|nr:hypothetical protein [Candidatus Roseilinea sp.]MDW8451598.1 hypothetical protein [Anaerolineae bacterium]